MKHTPDTFPGLFWGYAVIWTLVTLYIAHLGKRLRALEKCSGHEDNHLS